MEQNIELKDAIAAEVIVERVQSHEDTKDLKIQFNQGKPIKIPEPALIPGAATDYMFHASIRVPVPLSYLNDGSDNRFRLTVAEEQSWDWPQNLVYGLVLRVYYQNNVTDVPELRCKGCGDPTKNTLSLSLASTEGVNISKIEYIGLYEDVNPQGDGQYRQWQFRYHRGERTQVLATAASAGTSAIADLSWMPSQSLPAYVSALVTNASGVVSMTAPVEIVQRDGNHSVNLVKPSGQDAFWTTRNGEHAQELTLDLPWGRQLRQRHIGAVGALAIRREWR